MLQPFQSAAVMIKGPGWMQLPGRLDVSAQKLGMKVMFLQLTVSLNCVQSSQHSMNEGVVTLASYQSVSYRRGRDRQLVRHSFVRSDENERTRRR